MLTKVRKTLEHFLYSRKTRFVYGLASAESSAIVERNKLYIPALFACTDRVGGSVNRHLRLSRVGKTTLLLQHIKLKFEDSREALYVNLDDFWFETHSLTDAVKEFLQAGGHYFVFG